MSIISEIGGDLLGFVGQGLNSALNYVSNRNQQKRQNQMAEDQRSFEEQMSNTAYQRATEDMRKAGLNPMLAYHQGGASTPSVGIGDTTNYMSGVETSALDSLRLNNEIKESKTRQLKNVADAKLASTNADLMLNKMPESEVRSYLWTLGKDIAGPMMPRLREKLGSARKVWETSKNAPEVPALFSNPSIAGVAPKNVTVPRINPGLKW